MDFNKNSTYTEINKKLYRLGVGIVLLNKDNLIWTGNRSNLKDAWQMPQGGIDINESKETALFREMNEEIGTTKASIINKLDRFITYDFKEQGIISGQSIYWFFLRFDGIDKDFSIGSEFDNWKWASKDFVLSSIIDFKKEMYEKVLSFI